MFVIRCGEQYLKYSRQVTHTGTHDFVDWVDDINQADIFNWIPSRVRQHLEDVPHEILEVIENRTITLV